MQRDVTALIIFALIVVSATAPPLSSLIDEETFDFIVVGGGSSGSIVAGRLALSDYTVLLLEAGGPTQYSLRADRPLYERTNLTVFDVPLYWTAITSDRHLSATYEWPILEHPRPAIARGLGGCSVHNAMIYIRGLDRDFDDWGVGWQYEDVLPFYQRSVTQTDINLVDSPLHASSDGPLHLSSVHSSDRDPIAQAFISAARLAGLPTITDFNGPHRRDGAGYYQFLIKDGQRDTPASAMYGTNGIATRTKRLVVREWASVTRILLNAGGTNTTDPERTTPRAVGVEYIQSPLASSALPRRRALARHEVVISAGAINTPKLLLLSGIGPCDELAALGIPCIVERAGVGRNCMDGTKALMQWTVPSITPYQCLPTVVPRTEYEAAFCADQLSQYIRALNRRPAKAPFGRHGTPGFSAGAFLKSHSILERPNLQLTVMPWDKLGLFSHSHSKHGGVVTMEIATNNPISRGRVSLRSADPFDAPVVNVNYLAESADVDVLVWAIKEVRRIVRFAPLNTTFDTELSPGTSLTDKELRQFIFCGTDEDGLCHGDQRVLGHLAGTAKLGDPLVDPLVVVDSHLRVVGVDGLRVADASVMPYLPSGNTHATCLMIGERAAAFLIQAATGTESQSEVVHSSPKSVSGMTPINEARMNDLMAIVIECIAVICVAFIPVIYYRAVTGHWWRFVMISEIVDDATPLLQYTQLSAAQITDNTQR